MSDSTSTSQERSLPTPGQDAVPGPVTITPKAVRMVKTSLEEEGLDSSHGLRIAVMAGGCSGLQYALNFENEKRDNDIVYEVDGLTLYVDSMSSQYLQGTTVDYVMSPGGSGFTFENPQATGGCGCGQSFCG